MKWTLTQSCLASRGFLAVAVLVCLSCFSTAVNADVVTDTAITCYFYNSLDSTSGNPGLYSRTNTTGEGAVHWAQIDKTGSFEKIHLFVSSATINFQRDTVAHDVLCQVQYRVFYSGGSGYVDDSDYQLLGYLGNFRHRGQFLVLDETYQGLQTGISMTWDEFTHVRQISFRIYFVSGYIDSFPPNYEYASFNCQANIGFSKIGNASNEEEITGILEAVADIRDDVSGMSSSFDDIHSDLGTISEVMSENHASLLNRIDLVGDSIVEQLEDVNGALNSSLGSVTQRVNYVAQQTYAINTKMTTVSNDVASMKNSLSSVDTAVNEMADYTEDISHAVDGINTGVDGLNDGVASMNTALSSINSGIGSLNTNISGLNGQLSGINSNVSDIEDFLKDGDGDYSFSDRGYSDIVDSSEITSTMNGINSSMGIDSYNSKFSNVLGRVGSGGSTGLPFMDFNPEIGGNHIAFPTFEFASLGSPSALGTLLGCIKWLLVIAICWWLLIGTLNAFRA